MGSWGSTLMEAGGGGMRWGRFEEGEPGKGITFEMYINKISNKRKKKIFLSWRVGPTPYMGSTVELSLIAKARGKQPRECANRRTVPAPHRSSSPWESGPCSTVELTLETRVQVSQL